MDETGLWRCPTCGQTFTGRNMPHSCQVVPLDRHFEGRPPTLRAAFDAFVAAARANGPVTLNATKSRLTVKYLEPYHVHRLRLAEPADVDGALTRWLAEAYAVGAQAHLRRPPPPAAPPAPDRPSTGSR